MPSQPPLHTAVFAAIDSGALMLTANQRAARTLHSAYARRMRAEGRTVWHPPAILTWESWTETLWQQLMLRGVETRVLLNPMQERLLWKDILAQDAESRTLRSPESLATLAAEAWTLLARYGALDANGGMDRLRAQFQAGSTDVRVFARWAQLFERHCRKNSFLPSAQLDAALTTHIMKRALPLVEKEIVLVGFDRLTSTQTSLCNALRDAGIAVSLLTSPVEAPAIHIVEAADPEAEIRAAARTIRQALTTNPEARIAVILPDVASVRSQIERIFLSELAPELQAAGETARRPFEFSLGITLHRIAMTRTALSLLRWTINPLPLEEISALLRSPYLAGAQSERFERAVWDAQQLRRTKLLEPEIPLTWLLRQPQLPPMLRTQLAALQKLATEMTAPTRQKKPLASYGAWMEHAAALLSAAGWPDGAERTLDSTEFQLHERWQKMLDEIATLDFAGERVEFSAALNVIERAAASTLFAARSHNAPVQIMGTLESAGSAFDFIWFLGATDMAWPSPASTHPFIPWAVQRDLGMPGTDSARSLADATAITQRIAASAPESTFSFAHRGSEGEQRPSNCLRALAGAAWLRDDAIVPASASAIALEDAPDDTTLPALPDTVVRGGATILEVQAACPFRAFAEKRLFSTSLDTTEAGLDAAARGSLIHQVMATFWNTVKTQHALAAMSPAERAAQLTTAIDAAFAPLRPESEWDRRYLRVQREWLARLLPQWLDVELARPAFEVLATERDLPAQRIGPLSINVRVDRIDTIRVEPDGAPNEIILDYKTGKVSRSAWFDDRLEQAQLPLYAVLTPERLTGVAFARLRTGDMSMEGISALPDQIKKTRRKKDGQPYANSEVRDLAAEIATWHEKLTAIAEEFAAGHSAVTPKRYPQTCAHCDQMVLCRIQENASLGNSEDEEAHDV